MTERSSDIEFDFFDEPATEEAARTATPRRRGGPRRPVQPPAGLTPLLRLVGLLAFAIVIVVLLVFWAQSCRADSKRDTYGAYMDDMRQVARDSDAIGRDLVGLFTTRGVKTAELSQRLNGLAQQQEQGIARTRELEAPGRLRAEHDRAVDALQLRAGGLRLLAQSFAQGAVTKGKPAAASDLLAQQVQRLLAGDVVWADLFRAPAAEVLRRQDLLGINVPESRFLTDPNLATARGMQPIVLRIRGARTGGVPPGKHGNGLVSVRALPGGQVLQTGTENSVTATADLRFEVTVENSGESQEVQVPVRLTVQQSPEPIVRTQTITAIDPGRRQVVVFRNLGQIVQFAQKTTVKVVVEKVPGETNTANNSAEFEVTFVLTPA